MLKYFPKSILYEAGIKVAFNTFVTASLINSFTRQRSLWVTERITSYFSVFILFHLLRAYDQARYSCFSFKKSIRTIITILLISFFIFAQLDPVFAQTTYALDWDSVMYPPLSFDQTFSNINNSGVDIRFLVTGNTNNVTELFDANTYSGTQSGVEESLTYRLDLTNTNQSATMTVSFSQPVTNLRFTIHDIDRQYYLSFGRRYYYNYIDRLQFQGIASDGTTIAAPQFTNPGKCVSITGSVVDGSAGNPTDTDCSAANNTATNFGDVTVTFPQEINSFSYVYSNTTNKTNWIVNDNPNTQVLGLGDLSFDSVWDYGDLPASYATDGLTGARHFVPANPDLFIGSISPDDEFSAFASDTALAEDTNGVDEDGFESFPALPVSSTTYTLNVPLTNNTGSDAQLGGWIDFNFDGTFSNSEFSSTIVPNDATSASIIWNSIPVISVGTTFSRLRLASDFASIDTNSSSGSAMNGEVEDYTVSIQSATAVTLSGFDGSSGNPFTIPLTFASFSIILILLSSEKHWRTKILACIKNER